MENNERPYAVMVFDGKNFKSINDTFGHKTGDAAIKTSVEAIRASVRTDDLVARLGGDEFAAIIFTDGASDKRRGNAALEPKDQLDRALKRVHANLANQLEANYPDIHKSGYRLTAGGVLPEPDETFHDALQAADAVMYVHKSNSASGDPISLP